MPLAMEVLLLALGLEKGAAVSAYLLLMLVALLVLGLMWCCKGSFNMKEWPSHVFTTAGLGQLNLFSSTGDGLTGDQNDTN